MAKTMTAAQAKKRGWLSPAMAKAKQNTINLQEGQIETLKGDLIERNRTIASLQDTVGLFEKELKNAREVLARRLDPEGKKDGDAVDMLGAINRAANSPKYIDRLEGEIEQLKKENAGLKKERDETLMLIGKAGTAMADQDKRVGKLIDLLVAATSP